MAAVAPNAGCNAAVQDYYCKGWRVETAGKPQLHSEESGNDESDGSETSYPVNQNNYYHKGWRIRTGTASSNPNLDRDDTSDVSWESEVEDRLQAWLREARNGKKLQDILQEMLESGGDERSVTNPKTGLTKYHTPTKPCQGIFRSSCTSNVPMPEAFNRGVDTLRQLLLESKNISKQQGDGSFSSPNDLFRKLLCDVRERLRSIFELSFEDTISLFPSGTDAEFMPTLFASTRALLNEKRGQKVFSIVTAAGEVGSGTMLASTAKHFAKLMPNGENAPVSKEEQNIFNDDFSGLQLAMRDDSGKMLDMAAADKLVEDTVKTYVEAIGEDGRPKYGCIVVHRVVGSKTGQCMPSEACLDRLVEKYGDVVLPVVDACQGRVYEGAVRQHLARKRIVLCTGSKFFGGPPFCGACFMSGELASEFEKALQLEAAMELVRASRMGNYVVAPLISDDLQHLRALLPMGPLNYGILMRWTLSLHYMEQFYADIVPSQRIDIMRSWTQGVRSIIHEKGGDFVKLLGDVAPTADHEEQEAALSTIISFRCFCNRGQENTCDKLSMDELRRVQFLLASDMTVQYPHLKLVGPAATRCFIGQPVDLNPKATEDCNNVLRVACSAPLVVRAFKVGLEPVIDDDRILIEKLTLILGNWYMFGRTD
eukprot:TRINITY_DN28221_c0_g2_i2.p1 TRINITY_DN28221_c0_g2~~TRINITY_DN28221_c0_g2_i2.p1  ORF type:complete len:653 (+),score=158.94 TRINITY_DN28221_c0_g2_i2:77-2035(+)